MTAVPAVYYPLFAGGFSSVIAIRKTWNLLLSKGDTAQWKKTKALKPCLRFRACFVQKEGLEPSQL